MLCDECKPDLMGITETWFKGTSVVEIKGYSLYRKDRNDGIVGGGVALYVNENIYSYELVDPCFTLSKLGNWQL